MRVLVVAETYLPYLSGVTVSTEVLVRGLGARGHEVMLLAPRPRRGADPGSSGAAGPAPQYQWLPSYQLPRPVPPGYRLPSPVPSLKTQREVEQFRPQVVHAQSPFVAGLLARAFARRAGAPLVLTHHTRFREYRHYLWPLSGLGAALVDGYTRSFWSKCAAVIAPSSDFAREIEGRLSPGRRPLVAAIPTGVEAAALACIEAIDPRPRYGWRADALVAVSLGRLGREKSVGTLLEAVALARRSEARLKLLVIGGGPLAGALRKRAAAPDLAGHVAFEGEVPRPRALATLKGGDLFLFASQTETQGLVLAEALACGLPVVAAEGPGVYDSLSSGTDSVVVQARPEERAAALAGALTALAADRERLRALALAAPRAAERASVEARLVTMEQLYQRVSAEHECRPHEPLRVA